MYAFGSNVHSRESEREQIGYVSKRRIREKLIEGMG